MQTDARRKKKKYMWEFFISVPFEVIQKTAVWTAERLRRRNGGISKEAIQSAHNNRVKLNSGCFKKRKK